MSSRIRQLLELSGEVSLSRPISVHSQRIMGSFKGQMAATCHLTTKKSLGYYMYMGISIKLGSLTHALLKGVYTSVYQQIIINPLLMVIDCF